MEAAADALAADELALADDEVSLDWELAALAASDEAVAEELAEDCDLDEEADELAEAEEASFDELALEAEVEAEADFEPVEAVSTEVELAEADFFADLDELLVDDADLEPFELEVLEEALAV